MTCAVTAGKVSRVPAENEFFGFYVVDWKYNARATVGFVSGVVMNVRVFPFFFVIARDDNVSFVVCDWGSPFDPV